MKTTIAAVVTALLLSAVATQVQSIVFSGNAMSLLTLVFLVSLATTWVTVRVGNRDQGHADQSETEP